MKGRNLNQFQLSTTFFVIAFVFSGCVDRGGLSIFPSDTHMDYKTTGFEVSHPKGNRLLIRSVQDSRSKYIGQEIAGKKTKITDSAFRRNMAEEFEMVLLRELRASGLFREVLLTEKTAEASDYVLNVDLQALFSEVKGFMVNIAGSAVQFKAVLVQGNKVLMDQSFSEIGKEGERGPSGFISTVAHSLNDVAAIAIRKAMQTLLERMSSALESNVKEYNGNSDF